MPTIGTRHAGMTTDTGFRVATGARKIVCINDRMMVAFAGDVLTAKTIIADLLGLFRDTLPSATYLEAVLRGTFGPVLASGRISLMIVLRDGGRSRFLQFNCRRIDLPVLGPTWVAGSGVDSFTKLVQAMAPPLQSLAPIRRPLGTILSAFHLAGCMLGAELTTGNTLAESFGLYYEVADCSGETFSFVTDVCFVFWTFPPTHDRRPVSTKLMKRLNEQESTIFYSVDLPGADQGGPLRNGMITRMTIGVDSPALPPPPDAPDLHSSIQVNVFSTVVADGSNITTAVTAHADDPKNHLVSFRFLPPQIQLVIWDGTLDRITRDLLPLFRNYPPP